MDSSRGGAGTWKVGIEGWSGGLREGGNKGLREVMMSEDRVYVDKVSNGFVERGWRHLEGWSDGLE